MILKMMNVFDIRELVECILSFIPKRKIGPCLLVNKMFYGSVKIEKDQDEVARTNDLYSLGKIPYSPIAVMNIAKKYGNTDIMRYLFKKNYCGNIDSDNPIWIKKGYGEKIDIYNPYWMAGFIGDEDIYNKLCLLHKTKSTDDFDMYEFICGICEGSQIKLFEKYKKHIDSVNWVGLVVSLVYKINNYNMIKKVDELNKSDKFKLTNFQMYKMTGYFSHEDIKLDYVENNIMKSLLGGDKTIFQLLCNCLVFSNNYDIFRYVIKHDKNKNHKYECINDKALAILIQHNNYEFFFDIFTNYYDKYGDDGDIDNMDPTLMFDVVKLACLSIEFRRCNILLLFLKYYHFDKNVRDTFIERGRELHFDDIIRVIEEHEKIDI
jgi:hypothetical protein